MTGTSLLPFYSADATTMLARALLVLQRWRFPPNKYTVLPNIFSLKNFADKKNLYFTYEFIPHLKEGNRKTQAIEALRFLLC